MSDNTYGSYDLRYDLVLREDTLRKTRFFLAFMIIGQIFITQIKFIFGGTMNFCQS